MKFFWLCIICWQRVIGSFGIEIDQYMKSTEVVKVDNAMTTLNPIASVDCIDVTGGVVVVVIVQKAFTVICC